MFFRRYRKLVKGSGAHQQILDFHDMLNVPFDATAATIRSAYLRSSRLVHPNNARIRRYLIENPDDEIKFTNAFQLIKRSQSYLLCYADENQNDANNGANERANKRSNKRANKRANNRGNNNGNNGHNNGTNNCSVVKLFLILPLVLIGLYWVPDPPDPIFRFKSDSEFVTKNHTEFGKIQYFVRSDVQFDIDFSKTYDKWHQLETDVIYAYEHKLHIKCNRAKSEGTSACDKLEKIAEWKKSNPQLWNESNPLVALYGVIKSIVKVAF